MSESLREQAAWRKGKSPIIAKYSDDHKKLFAAIAGRGFLSLPGYAYDAENGLELTAKMALSELNMKILGETIERELKQSGIDYDLAYKNALITWEIEKQDLMAAWEKELSGIKKGEAEEEEVLNQLEIETAKRGTYLIEQKTIIELAAEAYKLQLAELDGTTAPYEVTLANEKLLTAQKKLEIIPILQAIVVKEQEVLVSERAKADAYALLMAAENEIAIKKQSSLIPAVLDLVNVSEEYTGELAQQIVIEEQIADEKKVQAGIAKENAEQKVLTAQQEILLAEADLALETQKVLLTEAKYQTEESLLTKGTSNIQALTAVETAADATILADEKSTQAYTLDEKRTTINAENAIKLRSSGTTTDAEKGKIQGITNSETSKIARLADLNAKSTLTASLTHLIGG
jgi:uncharacterized protein YacL (UPF0231 family)